MDDAVKYFEAAATVQSKRVSIDGYFACPCCEKLTLGEAGGYEICDVCGWEDDPVQEDQPDLSGGANGMSLSKARENFKQIGYSCPIRLRRNLPLKLP